MDRNKKFWDAQRGLVLVTIDGALRLTQAGRALYAPFLAKHGFSPATLKTTAQFDAFLIHVNADILEAKFAELDRVLDDPATSKDACALILSMLAAELAEGAVFDTAPEEADAPTAFALAGMPAN